MKATVFKSIGNIDVRKRLLGFFTLVLMLLVYKQFGAYVQKNKISNAANEYAPLVSECLEQSSTLECLGKLKLIADKATFEATQKVALEQN
ncbi:MULTISPECIES: hypothetical protein [Vibrio]|uniref:hypothetical protein n=1 Tax=Vibrio TaxID=662 RepID=UPI00078BF386|nr:MULTISPECIES: hypothetical protein [Vibrio]BAU71042.1 hypothetical protein [Vibrio sp. 04Ya108]BBM67696.1 hypothetical protein VA249_43420 [Vibrio alfacsensis]BCN27193.1 hypothetical protein VYA_43850 [Vibrio alfacsensis]